MPRFEANMGSQIVGDIEIIKVIITGFIENSLNQL